MASIKENQVLKMISVYHDKVPIVARKVTQGQRRVTV